MRECIKNKLIYNTEYIFIIKFYFKIAINTRNLIRIFKIDCNNK